ncbi:MAG: flagellar assembly protein FliW [Bacillota bacterium]
MSEIPAERQAEAEEKVFEFPAGLFGFPTVKRYIVEEIPGGGDIFKQLVALDDPDLAFTLVFPFPLFPEYAPDIPDEELREVGAESTEQILLYAIANVPQQFKEATANLRAPLIFNPFTRKGRQLILTDDRYTTRERLFKV